jgi:TPR repeat protein
MTALNTFRLRFLFANSRLREAILLLAATASFISGSVAQIKPLSEDELGRLLAKAENGSRVAQVQVGKAFELGRAGNIDYDQAARWYRKAADQGDPDAQNSLGVLYLSGRGVPRDPAQAERWLLRSASTGFPLAQHNLGILYLGGWQIPADPERGMELVTRAATAGLEVSQLQLGFAYLTGRWGASDPELGLKWIKRAARHRLPAAEFVLGTAYENGKGTKPDIDKALQHYRNATESGYAAAQNNLGRLYLEGRGVQKDTREAMRLFTASANQGNPESYFNLAICWLKGCDGVVDAIAAYGWYLSGTATGKTPPEPLQKAFTQIGSNLLPEDLKKAQSTSQTWIAQHPAADPHSPMHLDHVPGATLAMNPQTGTAKTEKEVLKSLWQQAPYTQTQSPIPASVH